MLIKIKFKKKSEQIFYIIQVPIFTMLKQISCKVEIQ